MKKIFFAAIFAMSHLLAGATADPMVDPNTGVPYPKGTAVYQPQGTVLNPGPITQSEINSIADPAARAGMQWQYDQGKQWQTQADGIERSTDVNAQGKTRGYFTPQKLTAADCLIGRHWELIGGYAGCVCDGDATHTRVSNDNPAACTVTQTGTVCSGTTLMNTFSNGTQTVNTVNSPACGYVAPPPPPPPVVVQPPPPPPPPAPVITYGTENQTLACVAPLAGSGISQSRSVTYTNGIATAFGAWVTLSIDCINKPAYTNYLLACFIKGTPVLMADGTEKPIEAVVVGDMVKTYDEAKHTFVTSPVKEALHHAKKMDTLVELSLTNDKVLTSNSVHLILVNGAYSTAGEIAKQFIGGADLNLTGPSGEVVKINSLKVYKKEVELFNLHVTSQHDKPKAESTIGHNYVAGGIVVHNEKAESTLNNWPGDGGVCFSRGGRVEYYYEYPRRIMCEF